MMVRRVTIAAIVAGACRGQRTGDGDSASPADSAEPTPAAAAESNSAATPPDSAPSAPSTAGGGTSSGGRGAPARPAGSDSVRGTIRVSGSSPFTVPTLRPAGGGTTLTLIGADTATLKRLSGLEIVVHGEPTSAQEFRVRSYVVRAANGAPVIDGVVTRDGDALVIVTADGSRVRLGNPPAALRDLAGARVWVGGPPETGPNPYGVIRK
jgi:hypothetical protein